MGARRVEEKREQIDEKPAIARAEVAVHVDLAIGVIVVGDLRRTGEDHHHERYAACLEQVRQLLHPLERADDAALDAERLELGSGLPTG
jgi:hypothetical protein